MDKKAVLGMLQVLREQGEAQTTQYGQKAGFLR